MKKRTLLITQAAMIAALYVILTLVANAMGLANMAVQVRLSEALTVLPVFTPAAIPGLFLGCLISNILIGSLPLDIVFGSMATLLGALGTYGLRKYPKLSPLPPILSNAIIVPWILMKVYKFEGSYWYFMATVGAGEIISCGILGMLLFYGLTPYKKYLL